MGIEERCVSGDDVIVCASFARAITENKISDYVIDNDVKIKFKLKEDPLGLDIRYKDFGLKPKKCNDEELKNTSERICYFAKNGKKCCEETVGLLNKHDLELLKELGYEININNNIVYISW